MNERRRRDLFSPEILARLQEITVSFTIPDIPEIKQGDNIGKIITERMVALGGVRDLDIFVIASKIVSKAEGRFVYLENVQPSLEAIEIFNQINRKSPELIQVIIDNSESYEIRNGVIIARHKLGFIITSAGVDNLDEKTAILLPENPDLSAFLIQQEIEKITGKRVAIIIADSEGRPDREGAGAISIGVSGINPLRINEIALEDGKTKTTKEIVADMLAAQGVLLMGQRGKGIPVVCIRGFEYEWDPNATLSSIIHK